MAGVSTPTASLVLRGKGRELRISDDTVEKVRLAAAELDYSPNLLVHSLQRGRTHVMSFFNSFRRRPQNDLYMDRLSTAIENTAGTCGYDVLVHCDFSRSPEDTYRFLNGGRADGLLLFAPLADDPLLPWLRRSKMPTVLINAVDRERVLASVVDDVADGMRQVADAFVDLGHRSVAAVAETGNHFGDSDVRIALLRDLLRERGIVLPAHRVVERLPDLTRRLKELAAEPDPPTAIFCWRDFVAYKALESYRELGISVPDQVSVVGYDGLPWPAQTSHTAASVSVDLEALAEASVAALDQLIIGDIEEPPQITLPVILHGGTTLGPAPSSRSSRWVINEEKS
jgi:DNA-binding LacI/PurR family transcriptional regulator